MPKELIEYRQVLATARKVLARIRNHIGPASTERQIADWCAKLLKDEGVHETWYYEVPALVLLGSRSRLSVSGREYVPSDELVGDHNLVTIDLSPLVGPYWGDLARSFAVEEGRVTDNPTTREFRDGFEAQGKLHASFCQTARPDRTFEQVWRELNDRIEELGFRNLDFLGNVGHSISTRREDRVYFEKGNGHLLSEVDYFTFEPHIGRDSGPWGFKQENIYYFDDSGTLAVL